MGIMECVYINGHVFKDNSFVIMYKYIVWLDIIQLCYIHFIILLYYIT